MVSLKADLHGTIFVTIVTKIRDNTCAVTKSVFSDKIFDDFAPDEKLKQF